MTAHSDLRVWYPGNNVHRSRCKAFDGIYAITTRVPLDKHPILYALYVLHAVAFAVHMHCCTALMAKAWRDNDSADKYSARHRAQKA